MTLTVKSLPAYSGEYPFSGLVGVFSIRAKADKTTLKAGESLTLTVRVEGTGNIRDAGPGTIDLPEGQFKVYDDNPLEEISLTSSGYQGYKLFKKAIVPVKAGKYTIDPIYLTYFDIEQKEYRTLATQEFHLDVQPSGELQVVQAQPEMPAAKVQTPARQEVALLNQDILDIKEGLSVLRPYNRMSLPFFGLLLAAPLILLTGIRGALIFRKKEISLEKEMTEKSRHYIRQAEKSMSGDEQFWADLYAGLLAKILSRGSRRAETLTPAEARQILEDGGVAEDRISEVISLLDTIESVRFGGHQSSTEDIPSEKTRQVFDRVKTAVKTLCAVFVIIGLVSAAPVCSQAEPASDFSAGIQLYRQGDYLTAAQKFEAVADTPVVNPHLFYNIGNAYLKAGRIGHAILWYERAKRLIPNDPDLNYNLAHALGKVKDKTDDAFSLTDILFSWEPYVPLKLFQGAAILLAWIFCIWAAIQSIRQRRVFSGTGILMGSVCLLAIAVTATTQFTRESGRQAVILQEQVAVRSGTSPEATTLFKLHAGTRVKVMEKSKGPYQGVFRQRQGRLA